MGEDREDIDDRLRALRAAAEDEVAPTSAFRAKAWREFQRALDPLAPPRPFARTRPR